MPESEESEDDNNVEEQTTTSYVCADCGTTVKQSFNVCPSCGEKLAF